MNRWIVNAAERSVREQSFEDNPKHIMKRPEELQPGEFFWTGTYADAMAAGARRRLAEKAVDLVGGDDFLIVADRIEPKASDAHEARRVLIDLQNAVSMAGFDVWREGSGLVILGRRPMGSSC